MAMSTTDSVQTDLVSDQKLKFEVRSSSRKLVTFLLACCLILTVFSSCLLTALVLIGKFYIHNNNYQAPSKDFQTNFTKGINTKEFDQSLKSENLTLGGFRGSLSEIEAKFYRLPEGIVPTHYDITLRPNLNTGVLNGSVVISMRVLKELQYVVLNAYLLNISEIQVMKGDDTSVLVRNFSLDEKYQMMAIYLDGNIQPGEYFLSIAYTANMKNTMLGMYLSSYRTKDNETRTIAASKFEATSARRAFPCFDEPQLKAKFTVHIVKPKDPKYIALSNMRETNSEVVEDGIMVHFEESVKMSTYLVCFIVCDFEYSSDIIHATTEIPFRVFATPEQKSKTTFATMIGKKIIEYFNKYFELDYPLPKLDMIAIPDFVTGAMEHWGLITFRETTLLYQPNVSDSVDIQNVASVVAHEFVHSWFGNLVTMKWWNELWLSEGFATYILFKGLDEVLNEEWKMMDQFLTAKMHAVLKTDATLSSHPIVEDVVTPDEISSIFDVITYNKGATVLRMLEDAVSEDVFRRGVINYLKAHSFSNAVTDDLWHELGEIMRDIDVRTFMKTWTIQTGYPIITVRNKQNSYVLTQNRYLTDPDAEETTQSPYNYRWVIPVTYITDENSTSVLVWFQHDDREIEIAKPVNSKWVKFNYKQVGMYRVNYEEEHWRLLIDHIKNMEVADRTHLVEESFALAASGHISYEIPLNLSRYFKCELEYVPWSTFADAITPIIKKLKNSQYLDRFNKYLRKIVKSAYDYYSWTEKSTDKHLDRRARGTVIHLACKSGIKHCTDMASRLFIEWLEGKSSRVSQELRDIMYYYGMENSPVQYWDQLFEKFVREHDAGEKLRLLQGLAAVRDTTYLTKLLELAKNETYIRSQDYFKCVSFIAMNPVGNAVLWDYFRENWLELVEHFTLHSRSLGRAIMSIAGSYSSQIKLDEIIAFFEKYPDAGTGERYRHLTIELVQNNIKWQARYKKTIEDWISQEDV